MVKVLIVDWDRERIDLLRGALAEEDWILVDVSDGPEALEKARTRNPEAIVLASEDYRTDSFLTNKSYEMRTPLNAVIGMTQLLLDSDLSPQQLEYAKIIRNGGRQLLDVVAAISGTSRKETDESPAEPSVFSLRDTIESVAELLAPPAQKKGLEVAALVRSDVADSILGDQERLRQILINLVDNAIKFTTKGEIVIAAKLVDADGERCSIEFSVRDTGQGLPDETRISLSRTFAKKGQPAATDTTIAGYGLTLCKHLVDQLGGTISVDRAAGRGTIFRVVLPLRTAPERPETAPNDGDALRSLRVLCVDDSPSCLSMIEGHLRRWGIDVLSARSGQHAMEQLLVPARPEEAIGLVIVDKLMPGMDGVELTRSIRNIPELSALPVILMTPLAFAGRESVLKPLGISGFVTKPIRPARLIETILQVLGIETDAAQRAPAPGAPDSAAGGGQVAPRRERILLVEDDPVNRKLALAFLQRLGFQPVAACDGKDALNALGSSVFDLVLMDCQMPELDGFETTRLIREHERATGEHMPVIALTAHAMAEDRERCLAAGMDSYLSKPVVINELAKELDRFLLAGTGAPPTAKKPVA